MTSTISLTSPMSPNKREREWDALTATTTTAPTIATAEHEETPVGKFGTDHSMKGNSPQGISTEAAESADEEQLMAPPEKRSNTQHSGRAVLLETDVNTVGNRPAHDTASTASHATTAMTTPNKTAERFVLRRKARPPTTVGSYTRLHAISQLETLLRSGTHHHTQQPSSSNHNHNHNSTAATAATAPPLQIAEGESILVLLHQGLESLLQLINDDTERLSMLRVFSLDITDLPPQEYTEWDVQYSQTDDNDGEPSHPHSATHTVSKKDEEDEEEQTLMVSCRPHSCGPNALQNISLETLSLSEQLHIASDAVIRRLTQLLQVDSILNPHISHLYTNITTPTAEQVEKKEPLQLPALVLWRAAGAPTEEYPPAPPQIWSSQPTAAEPVTPFCDRMARRGGPLAVKPATGVDTVHCYSLWQPVYTMEHFYRTLRAQVPQPCGNSRTIVYLGASWCPPCKRILKDLPAMMREDFPSNVQGMVKADMDLAKPIFDFFKVEVIPTFIVLDNDVLFGGASAEDARDVEKIQQRMTRAEKGRVQNSQRSIVRVFVDKHCKTLSFDEDF